MTNAEILILFLKKHRKYTTFKRYVNNDDTASVYYRVDKALARSFIWTSEGVTEGSEYWLTLHRKWEKLCEEFNLEGTISWEDIK